MKTFLIRDIIPGKAAEGTLTPGRKFLQVIFKPLADEGFLVTERTTSRNFWDAFISGEEDGLNIAADQLFLSICEECGIDASNIDQIKWEKGTHYFNKAYGRKVRGDVATHIVEGYNIPGSQSKIDTRYRYTTMVLDGEDENSVFRTQGHVIVRDPEKLAEINRRLEEIASINEQAREERQKDRGVAPPTARRGTGAITAERSLNVEANLSLIRETLQTAMDVVGDNPDDTSLPSQLRE